MNRERKQYFHPIVDAWFRDKYGSPSDAQAQAWPRISAGEHVLVSAPTGSGKTLTAFLAAIDALIRWPRPGGGLRVLYVSPLKALNNDIRQNLLTPLAELKTWWNLHAAETSELPAQFPAISVMTRSGDSTPAERRKMIHSPPEILITTPESLNLLLTSQSGRVMLSTLDTLILDEIHALAGSKRGVHLITAVERLTLEAGEFQRIGLSATVRPLETVAAWMGGFKLNSEARYTPRPVSIIRSIDKKEISIQLKMVQPDAPDEGEDQDIWWISLARDLVSTIRKQNSTLVFTNSRRMAEKLTRYINEAAGEVIAYSHHGSLSKEIRLNVEQRLKAGELKAIVATSSLELGIDIGVLDRVIMVQTPFSVSSALQRIGRAGHQLGALSEADLIPMYGLDSVNAVVMTQLIRERSIEVVESVRNPLDILAQVLLSMMCRDWWNLDSLYAFIRSCWSYHTLDRRFFDLTVDMLGGRYSDAPIRDLRPRLEIDVLNGSAIAREGSDFLLYQSGGTIPDRGYFHLRLASDKSLIGELDEEFVWERQIGDQFTLGTNAWQILEITQNDVEVRPADPNRAMIPFWKAETLNQSFFLSSRIADFLEEANMHLEQGDADPWLSKLSGLDPASAQGLTRFLAVQRSHTGTALPSRHHIVLEQIHRTDAVPKSASAKRVVGRPLPTTNQIVLHTFWGGKLNRPFALALSAAWEERFGSNLEFYAGNECILLEFPDAAIDSEGHEWSAVELVTDLVNSKNLEPFLRKKLEHSGIFAAHFRENAARALLLPRGDARRRFPLWLNRLRSKKLLDSVMVYPDFPMIVETWRECLEDEFDLANLKVVLDEIASGSISLSSCVTQEPSPFANNVVWQQTNFYMYQDDSPSPGAGNQSGLSDEIYQQLLADARLQPRISAAIATELEEKLLSLWPSYRPRTPGDLVSILNEQGIMTADLWDTLCRFSGTGAASDPYFERDLSALSRIFARFRPDGAAVDWVVALPQLPGILAGLGYTLAAPPTDLPKRVTDWLRTLPGRLHPNEMETRLIRNANDTELLPEIATHPGFAQEALLHRWMTRRGPVSVDSIHHMFGWSHEAIVSILTSLVESERIVSGLLIKDDERLLFCESDNYERLLRMVRQSNRRSFVALPRKMLDVFVADWQGLLNKGNDLQSLQDNLDRLFAYPLPAGYWERIIFPSRINSYQAAWLDSLFANKGLAWFGCGSERIAFTFAEDLEKYHHDGPGMQEDGDEELLALLPQSDAPARPRVSLLDIARLSARDSERITSNLWRLAWQGSVSVDSFEPLRRGIASGFAAEPVGAPPRGTRSGFKRWEHSRPISGGWFRISPDRSEDVIEHLEWTRESVFQVLRRYGIVFREILQQELPQLRWKELFRTLRLMELSGEVITGRFFEGIPGIQFASPLAWRRLQIVAEKNDTENPEVWWINAIDPASLCGLGLATEEGSTQTGLTQPRRLASNWMVYVGTELVMVVRRNGKDIETTLEPGHALWDKVLAFFPFLLSCSTDVSSPLVVETINSQSAPSSSWVEDFRRAEFKSDYKSLMLWKKF